MAKRSQRTTDGRDGRCPVQDRRSFRGRNEILIFLEIQTSRATVQKIVNGRITFTPSESDEDYVSGYRFEAQTRFNKLLEGVASPRPASAGVGDRRGWADLDPMRDTLDGEYEELLARFEASTACERGGAPGGNQPLY